MVLTLKLNKELVNLPVADSFQDIQVSSTTRPQSPTPMEGLHPKLSSSPPKAASVWPNLNSAHKKGTRRQLFSAVVPESLQNHFLKKLKREPCFKIEQKE